MTDATPGVSEPNRTRMSALDAIAGDEPEENPSEQASVELEALEGELVTEQESGAGTTPEEVEKAEVEVEEQAPAAAKPATHRLKIDGEEREVPEAELIEVGKRALQKELAADKRLEEATRLLNEAKQQRQTVQPPKDAAKPAVDADVVKAIQYGTEEEAAKALGDLMGRNSATPEQIDQIVDQRVAQVMTQKDISTRFSTEFADVVKDPDLFEFARAKVQRRLDAGEPNTWATYEAAGKEVADKFVKPQVSDPAVTLDEKRAKKSSVTVIKSAAGAKPGAGKDDKPETPAQIIQEIRKARHQT
jgi:hypothetical protein